MSYSSNITESPFTNIDFGVTETTIMDMCDEVLGVGAALKARIATDRDTGK